ncbi:MAG: signal peptide peptidase SppA [Myxococcota bacterium]|nr:signal peptide peptidase SppA [Myxococcota bacterium]
MQSRSRIVKSWLFGVACLAITAQGTAEAQPILGDIVHPHGDVVTGVHADSTVVNPAGLGYGHGAQLSYTYARSAPTNPGDGYGLSGSLKLGQFYGTGISFERINPPGYQRSLPGKFSWSHGISLHPLFSIGLGWHYYSGRALGGLDEKSLFSAGLQLRPWRWIGLGGVVRNLNEPLLEGSRLQRNWSAGLSIRPGTEKLQLTGLIHFDEASDDWSYGARFRLNAFDFVSLVARYDTTPTDGELAHRLTVGVSSLLGLETGIFYHAPNLSSDDGRSGMAIAVRTKGAELPHYDKIRRRVIAHVRLNSGQEYVTSGLFFRQSFAPFLRTMQTLKALETAPNVVGVLIQFNTAALGWAQVQEIERAVERLRAAGKKTYGWMPLGDSRTYSLAARFDEVITTPSGGLLLTGMVAESQHIKGLLDMVGIKAEFITTGAYKTAPEVFTRSSPSEAQKTVQNALADQLYEHIVGRISQGRKLKPATVRALIDDGPYTALRAQDAGLVDHVMHFDEFETHLRQVHGQTVSIVPATTFLPTFEARWGPKQHIAVLYVVGTITDGPSTAVPLTGTQTTGADTIVRAADALARDNQVKAVVVRIDSPGGSVTASDAMWHALSKLSKIKPVYVSMGDIAASGGYYAAVPGREIFAMGDTITGSIGVFSGKFDLSGMLDKLGISVVQFRRGEHAGLLGMQRPWSASERAAVRRSMDALYNLFLKRILTSRTALDDKALRAVAAGRVWTGDQARARQLVDREGGLLDAITAAARASQLDDDDYEVVISPPPEAELSLPRSPLGFLESLGCLTPGQSYRLPAILDPLVNLWDEPIFRFNERATLALLPWSLRSVEPAATNAVDAHYRRN